MEIDLPNGGTSYLIGNIIQQGPASQNSNIVNFGAEGLSNAGKDLYVVNNTLVNDRPGNGIFVNVRSGGAAKVWNNLFVGSGTAVSGTADTAANWSGADPGFLDKAAGDYRLSATSVALDKGRDAGTEGGFALMPAFQYAPNASSMPRPERAGFDLGAYEAGTEFPAALRGFGWGHRSALPGGNHRAGKSGGRDALGRMTGARFPIRWQAPDP
jgi:hypothetical protein